MTFLTFKAFEIRSAVLEKLGGSSGIPLYQDEDHPLHGKHIKEAPSSPQWQRKLEAPLRVVLGCIKSHPDHNSSSRLTILWKTLTIFSPVQDADFHEDITAWARLHYYQSEGEFRGRLEMVQELRDILEGRPIDQSNTEETLWQEQWNKLLCGPHLELDKAEAASFAQAKTQAGLTGKGAQLGKGKRHWSNVAIYTDDYEYEPYPCELDMLVVEAVYFSWDEMCDKFKAEQRKIGDYGVATIQGKPPVSVGATIRTEGSQALIPAGQNAPAAKASSAANDPWVDYVPKGKGS